MHDAAEISKSLKDTLHSLTESHWEIELMKESATETLHEGQKREAQERIVEAQDDPDVKEVLAMFPGAEVVEVKENTNSEDVKDA